MVDEIQDKSKNVFADHRHVVITEHLLSPTRNWYERIICTIARVKVLFALRSAKINKFVKQSRKKEEIENNMQNNTALESENNEQHLHNDTDLLIDNFLENNEQHLCSDTVTGTDFSN